MCLCIKPVCSVCCLGSDAALLVKPLVGRVISLGSKNKPTNRFMLGEHGNIQATLGKIMKTQKRPKNFRDGKHSCFSYILMTRDKHHRMSNAYQRITALDWPLLSVSRWAFLSVVSLHRRKDLYVFELCLCLVYSHLWVSNNAASVCECLKIILWVWRVRWSRSSSAWYKDIAFLNDQNVPFLMYLER